MKKSFRELLGMEFSLLAEAQPAWILPSSLPSSQRPTSTSSLFAASGMGTLQYSSSFPHPISFLWPPISFCSCQLAPLDWLALAPLDISLSTRRQYLHSGPIELLSLFWVSPYSFRKVSYHYCRWHLFPFWAL
jgi:hypothetical protein